MNTEKIKKEEVKKLVDNLTPTEKETVKKHLDKLPFKEQVDEFFKNLKKKSKRNTRNKFVDKNNSIVQNLSKAQTEEMLDIISDLEREEYAEAFVNIDDSILEASKTKKMTKKDENDLKEKIDDYKKRRAKEEEEVKHLDDIKKIKITDKMMEDAIKIADASKLLSIKDDWMNLFNKICFENETLGEILFHAFFGQALKHITVFDGNGKKIPIKQDVFCIQNSSSGKGEAVDIFLKPIIAEVEWTLAEEDTEMVKNMHLIYSSFRGQSTLAGILNRFKKDKKGKYTDEVIVGPIQRSDFWIWTEADDLLNPSTYNQSLINALLDLMEGKVHEAFLEKYNKVVETHGTGSLIGTSRPVKNVEYFLVKSGLVHRTLPLMRNLKPKEFEKIVSRNALKSFGKKEDNISFVLERKELVKKINDIIQWSLKYIGKDYPVNNPNLLNSLMNKKMAEFLIDAEKDVKIREFRTILIEYVSRMRNKCLGISYQNAIIRKKPVDVQDVLNAVNVLNKCYTSLKYWMFENVILKKDVVYREAKIYSIIKLMLKSTPTHQCFLKDIKHKLEKDKMLTITGTYLYQKIREVIDTNSDEFKRVDKKQIKLIYGGNENG